MRSGDRSALPARRQSLPQGGVFAIHGLFSFVYYGYIRCFYKNLFCKIIQKIIEKPVFRLRRESRICIITSNKDVSFVLE